MLSWLKEILGDGYTDEIDKKISQEIGKNFVAKSDFNAKNEAPKNLEAQIADRDKQLEDLKKSTGDIDGLKAQIATPVCSFRALLRPAYLRHDLPSPHHGGT